MLTIGIFSSSNLTKAQQTTSGAVTIAFDDGWNSQFNNSFPLMQEHGFVGTYYIITSFIGTGDYMNMSDLHALQNAGNEIGSHTVDHQDLTYLTDAQINYECNASQQLLRANGFPATDFAYPDGDSNSHVDSIVLQYYRSARYAYGTGVYMTIPPTAIEMSIPMGYPGETGNSSIGLTNDENIVQWAHETNSWVIIFFHNILTTPLTTTDEIEKSDFAAFLNCVGNSSVQVLTVNQALNLWSSSQKVTILPSSQTYDLRPYSSTTMDVGQNQVFTATAYGGTSPYTYQWYQSGSEVGTNSTSYEFDPSSVGSFLLNVNTTDSSSVPVTVESNLDSITVNSALVAPIVSVDHGTVDQGQTSSLTSTVVTTGSSPYTYQWFEMAPGGSYSPISGATSSSYSFVTSGSTATGSWSFEVQVTDSASTPVTVTSVPVSVTVNGAPTVTVSPTSWTMDVGQSKSFTASANGGSGAFTSYQWYVGGVAQSGATSSTFSYSPASAGSYSITATVTDSLGSTSVQSVAATVTVAASPTVSIAPTGPLTLDVGQVQAFSATPSGGSGSLSYQWYLDGDVVGSNSASYSYTAAGSTHSVTCKVTDSASVPVAFSASNIVSVKVNPALTIPVISASLGTVDQGQTSTLSSTAVSSGTSPYTYQWLSKVGASSYSAISGATSSSYSFVTTGSTNPGVWSLELQVTDSASIPVVVTSSAASVTVNVAPTVTFSPTSWTLDIGQSKTFTAAPTGGSGTYVSYQWYVDSVLQSSQTASKFSYSPASSGSHSVTVTVTDDLSATSVQSSAVYVTVNSALVAPTVTATPSTVNQGQTSSLTSTAASTGTPPYTCQWFEEAPGAKSYSAMGSCAASFIFVTSGTTAAGKWSFILQVTDASGASVNSTVASVTLNSSLATPAISTSTSTVDQGQTSSLSISPVTTGTSPYTYQWFSEATTASSYSSLSGSVSSSYNFVTLTSTATGSWNFVLQVTDSTGAAVNSSLASVTVNAVPTVSVAPSSVALDVGQVQTFKATSNGGTGPLSYQWYLDGVAVGSNNASYSYTASGISHSVTCTVTDSATTPVTSPASIPVSVTVNPAPTPTPTPAPPSSHASSIMTAAATTESGATVDLALSGNITSSQMSNIKIATNQSTSVATLSFTVTGEKGAMGFGNITIPKSALPYGATPTIYVDGKPAQNQGYTQDSGNYYVWYTAHFSTDQISIVFASTPNNTPSTPSNPGGPNPTRTLLSLPQVAIYGIATTVAVVAIAATVLVLRKNRKGKR